MLTKQFQVATFNRQNKVMIFSRDYTLSGGQGMKAVLMDSFGGVEVLKVGEAQKPSPGEGQVLV